jgi:ankyrin repeat protein
VRLMLTEEGVDPDSKDSSSRTPLFVAAEHGREAVVWSLLAQEGVNLDSRDESGRALLSIASWYGGQRPLCGCS